MTFIAIIIVISLIIGALNLIGEAFKPEPPPPVEKTAAEIKAEKKAAKKSAKLHKELDRLADL